MKILISVIALVIASPALAQTAPAGSQAQGHANHGQHHGQAGHGGHAAQHGEHDGHANHAQHGSGHGDRQAGHGCCADRDGNGRMDCCDHAADGHDGRAPAAAQPNRG